MQGGWVIWHLVSHKQIQAFYLLRKNRWTFSGSSESLDLPWIMLMKVQTIKVNTLDGLSYIRLLVVDFSCFFNSTFGPTSNLTERRTSEKVGLGYGCKSRDTWIAGERILRREERGVKFGNRNIRRMIGISGFKKIESDCVYITMRVQM